MEGDNSDERFPPSGGRFAGVSALVLGGGTAVLALLDSPVSWAAVAFGSLVAALGWTTFLRPRVSIEDDDLVLRGMVQTVRVPVAAVEGVAVRQVLAVRAGERRFTSAAVGRSRRQIRAEERLTGPGSGPRVRVAGDLHGMHLEGATREPASEVYGLYVEERIKRRAESARRQLGLEPSSPEVDELGRRVRRRVAVPEALWLAGSLVAFVVLLLR